METPTFQLTNTTPSLTQMIGPLKPLGSGVQAGHHSNKAWVHISPPFFTLQALQETQNLGFVGCHSFHGGQGLVDLFIHLNSLPLPFG